MTVFSNIFPQHFKAAIDLITDAFFKHGEKDALRSCIKAITFCCTECQADLKDYAENKLKNLEDELVLKVKTAIKEVEVCLIRVVFFCLCQSHEHNMIRLALQAGDDEYSLLVNLKRLYELQLSKPVKNDSLFEDMYRILSHLRDMDNEVRTLSFLSFSTLYLFSTISCC